MRKAHYIAKDEAMELLGLEAGYMNIVTALNTLDGVSASFIKAGTKMNSGKLVEVDSFRICADSEAKIKVLLDDAYEYIFAQGWC